MGRALAFASLPVLLGATPAGAEGDLEVLVSLSLRQNQELRSIEAQIGALGHKTTRAGAWQDPKFSVAYQNAPVDSFSLGEEPMTMVALRLEQTVPLFGKTADRRAVVERAQEAKRWELHEKRNQLAALVKTAYWRLALARQLRRLTEEHVVLVDKLVIAVRGKYEVGNAAQQNLLRLEVLRDRLRDDLSDFDREDRELRAAINAAAHRDPETPIPTPPETSLAPPAHSLERLRALALEERPALKQLALTAQMHRAAADLAEREGVPDPTLFAAYGIRTDLPGGHPGVDMVTLGVGFPLPLFYGSRNAQEAAESREQARAVDASKEALLDALSGGLTEALATWSRAAEKVVTYRERLVPDARRVLESTLSSYQVDRAEFLSLYEAELDLLNFEKTIRSATVQGLVAQATIERLIGRTLP